MEIEVVGLYVSNSWIFKLLGLGNSVHNRTTKFQGSYWVLKEEHAVEKTRMVPLCLDSSS